MADPDHKPIFDYASLTAIGARLSDHADAVTNAARQDIANDLRLAAAIAVKFASLRFRVAEIAAKAIENPDWDNAAIARDLREALDAAAGRVSNHARAHSSRSSRGLADHHQRDRDARRHRA
jgi:hypothetical protein